MTIIATGDGGRTWIRQQLCQPSRCSTHLTDWDPAKDLTAVSFIDANSGWVVGQAGRNAYTNDGGSTWNASDGLYFDTRHPPNIDLLGVTLTVPAYVNSRQVDGAVSTAHAVGSGGTILPTYGVVKSFARSERGPHEAEVSGTTQRLRSVWFTDHLNGHAVGDGGTIVTTSDDGKTWLSQSSGTEANLSAVDFPDANNGFAVGDRGTVLALHTAAPKGLAITSVSMRRVPDGGRVSITVLGSGFTGAVEVNAGTEPAYGFAVESDGVITAVAPPHQPGMTHLTVVLPTGVSPVGAADMLTYIRPSGGIWQSSGSCIESCTGPAVVLPSGKVLIEGSGGNDSKPSAVAQLYDPDTRSWSLTAPMHYPRSTHTATLLSDGHVLVTGGYAGSSSSTTSAELYDPATGSWRVTGSTRIPFAQHVSILLNDGRVLIAGLGASAELYDPLTEQWSTTGSMHETRAHFTATLLTNGTVLAVGAQGDTTSAEIYDPSSGTWNRTGGLTEVRKDFTATLLKNGKVLVAGGAFQTPFRSDTNEAFAELYDPKSGAWSPTGPMVIPRADHTATLLPDGRVLVTGGQTSIGQDCPCGVAPYSEAYDPGTAGWELVSSMGAPREFHVATQLKDGSVLVTGGTDTGDPTSFTAAETYVPDDLSRGTAAGLGPLTSWVIVPTVISLVLVSTTTFALRRRRVVRRRRRVQALSGGRTAGHQARPVRR